MTNPDTSTLNGALEQLGITMADNLNTMGVSDADPSDGLTTLAGKILDIGPTPPTPTPASISLTADKSILSYADTESAVLTATVLDSSSNPVEGVSVDLYKDSVLWDTLTTGSAGTVSKTYTSAGIGDVGFTAECGSLVTETFVVHDLWYNDNLTSDKGHWTNWNKTGATRSFTSNGLSISGTNVGGASGNTRYCKLNITYPSNYSAEYEIVALDRTYDDYIVELGIEGVGLNSNSSKKFLFQLDKWSQSVSEYTGSLNSGDIVRWEYSNGTVSLYVNDVLIGSKSQNTNYSGFVINQYNSRGITFKNLKIKPL